MSKIKMNFDTDIAKDVGTDSAIIYSNIEYWVARNEANDKPDKHYHEGYWWTYNSIKAFNKLFDYLSPSQIKRCLKKLEDNGYIKTGVFNEVKYDKTKWYTCLERKQLRVIKKPKTKSSNGKNEKSQPIPNNKPNDTLLSTKVDKAKPVTHGNSDINAVIDEWERIFQYKLSPIKANRNYASTLIKQYSADKVIGAINFYASISGDPYTKKISNIKDLYYSWGWLVQKKIEIDKQQKDDEMARF